MMSDRMRRVVSFLGVMIFSAIFLLFFSLDYKSNDKENSKKVAFVINLHKQSDNWVVEDAGRGLNGAPLTNQTPKAINNIVEDLQDNVAVELLVSEVEFPGYEDKWVLRRSGANGNFYYSEKSNCETNIAPVFFEYFEARPRVIFIKATVSKAS